MYQLNWAIKSRWENEPNDFVFQSGFGQGQVDVMVNLNWEEHCVECAVPECYSSCKLYEKREDLSCARFVYGIYANPKFRGLYNFGADIRFRKWAKIEASLKGCWCSPLLSHEAQAGMQSSPEESRERVGKLFSQTFTYDINSFSFVFECFSPEKTSYKLILEHFTEVARLRTTRFRTSLMIVPGQNVYTIPAAHLNLTELEGYIYLYPEENEVERRIIFTWLDLVKLRPIETNNNIPTAKKKVELIKCVAWDLDNTLWRGVVSEDQEVTLNSAAVKLIRELDSRGILQTIVSKNDHEPAWEKLKEFGLAEYFLFPEINWGPKSESLIRIAGNLNIDINSFAVIDDSPFERAEIQMSLQSVRVYSDEQISTLLSYPEFDAPVSKEGANRRSHYITESSRRQSKEQFRGNYFQFLLSCQLTAVIFEPSTTDDIGRCYELVQRSNQMNLVTRRYLREEFMQLFNDDSIQPLAIRCSDRFGDYGIVGFGTLQFTGETVIVRDFVISCRAAQKKIENAFFKMITDHFFANGFSRLEIPFVPSMKNQPLFKVLEELSLKRMDKGNSILTYVAERGVTKMGEVPVKVEMNVRSLKRVLTPLT